jgi:hypothetical protein
MTNIAATTIRIKKKCSDPNQFKQVKECIRILSANYCSRTAQIAFIKYEDIRRIFQHVHTGLALEA